MAQGTADLASLTTCGWNRSSHRCHCEVSLQYPVPRGKDRLFSGKAHRAPKSVHRYDSEGLDTCNPESPAQYRHFGALQLVTGGTRGIGRAIAEGFGQAGGRVLWPAGSLKRAQKLRKRSVRRASRYWHRVPHGVVRRRAGSCSHDRGAIWWNRCRGEQRCKALAEPIGSFTNAGLSKSIDVNVKGPIFLIQESLPYLRVSDHASVINVVSAGAWLFSAPVALRRRQGDDGHLHQGTRRWTSS